MDTIDAVPRGEYVPSADRRVILSGIDWVSFETVIALRGDKSSPRLAFLDREMELMSPSRQHGRLSRWIGMLVQTYAVDHGITHGAFGGWRLTDAAVAVGVEPDECYLFGPDQHRERPDLAIEIVWTSGGIGKLEIYRRLRIPEIWIWKAGSIQAYLLRGDAYEESATSACLPGIDLPLLASCLDRPTLNDAVAAFRSAR